MRSGPTDELVAGHGGWKTQITGWLGSRVTVFDVPITSGRVSADVTQQVPEKLSITVPRVSTVNGRLFDWLPGVDVEHPLAKYGQTLTAQIVTTSAITGRTWTTKINRYRIQNWEEQGDGIHVEAVGMLQRVAGDDLTSPVAPLSDGTFKSEFQRLLPSGFSVTFDPALVDRPIPQSLSWTEDRLGALYEIADGWPARLRTSEDGWRLLVLPPLPYQPVPVLKLKDGNGGVVVSALSNDSRDGVYNRINAKTSGTDSPQSEPLQIVRDISQGPLAPSGNYGPETINWSTPLAKTLDQLDLSAKTYLETKSRQSRKLKVTMKPDPRVDADDPVLLVWRGRSYYGYVLAYDMPLVLKGGGPMTVLVGVV